MAQSLAGRLLVATPGLEDPNFRRTVVLMVAHNDDGSFGLVLNRPVDEVDLRQVLPAWAPLAAEPPLLFTGGPVEPSSALALGRAPDGPPASGWTPVVGDVGLVSLNEGPEDVALRIDRVRIFAGYAGWGAGQLEDELRAEAWFVVDALPADAFTPEPATLWREVLRRQPGKLAMFAFYPEDPARN